MSKFTQTFKTISLDELEKTANDKKENGWRYVQTLAVKVDNGTDIIYSFMKDGAMENIKIQNVKDTDTVKSITDFFIEAFVWENEIHDLFNINFEGIAIDFKGKFYNVATDAPMSVIGAEAKERKLKQAKIEAALAAKAAKAKEAKNEDKKSEVEGE